jgi:hypothetical protein
MKQGRIVEDGPCSRVMQERELLANARVSQPQLVALYEGLQRKPEGPFLDVLEARAWVNAKEST